MEKSFEATYHSAEQSHWWFISRRLLVRELVIKAQPSRTARILEIGCSGGPLLEQLRACGYTQLTGIDISTDAVRICQTRKLGDVRVMDAQQPDFPPASFDVITASDVLEHLADAPRALRAWHALLRPGGTLIVFVPAFISLWSDHDVVNQHFHRYRANELAELLKSVRFDIHRKGYWNFTLFAPVAAVRAAKRFTIKKQTIRQNGDLKAVPGWINGLLTYLLRLENRLIIQGLNFPWGVSALVVASKPSLTENEQAA